jgi:hypothetical protein
VRERSVGATKSARLLARDVRSIEGLRGAGPFALSRLLSHFMPLFQPSASMPQSASSAVRSRLGRFGPTLLTIPACAAVAFVFAGCGSGDGAASTPPKAAKSSVELVAELAARADEDPFTGVRQLEDARAARLRLRPDAAVADKLRALSMLGEQALRMGEVDEALRAFDEAFAVLRTADAQTRAAVLPTFTFRAGVASLRKGEVDNCCARWSPESCVVPIRGAGLHAKPEGSKNAIARFTEVLQMRGVDPETALNAKWLLNVAHMTLGTWPQGVPEAWRLPANALGAPSGFPRFANVATAVGIKETNLSGGVAADDFDGDGRIDLVVSDWSPAARLRFYRSAGDGTFEEKGVEVGFEKVYGGLNLVLNDYDLDGRPDVLVLRGAWAGMAGRQPVTLLRNVDGRFEDVTDAVGLGGALGPTPSAAFADYDGDGDLDLFQCVESQPSAGMDWPCRLFRNDGGKFVDVAKAAGVENRRWAKGCSWGDYDADGDPDLYVSNLGSDNRLYRNDGAGTFTDVAPQLGVVRPKEGFACWFFDADQDGVLDLFGASTFYDKFAATAAAYFGRSNPEHWCRLYRGDGKGGFQDVTEAWGLTKAPSVMGAAFGDLDGDGYPEIYLGTGAPDYAALQPNVMYRNVPMGGGRAYQDVTLTGGFGLLQKGHAIAFADFDNDGHVDVFAQTGGAYAGDAFRNALFANPGFEHRRLDLSLVGVKANRGGFGARIRVEIEENGATRDVYCFVGSRSSFGGGPLEKTLGLGKASRIKTLEVRWPKPSGLVQTFRDVPLDAFVEVREDADELKRLERPHFKLRRS